MIKRPVKAGSASLKALGTVVALGVAAHAALPYLPLVGPPPLRLQTVKVPAAPPVAAEFQEASLVSQSATNTTAVAETNLSHSVASLIATNFTVSRAITPAASLEPQPESVNSVGDAFNASIFVLPTPDLLGITPQTLATYFHPVQVGTNQPAVAGLFPLSFVPPLPPEKSSHAEYIVK